MTKGHSKKKRRNRASLPRATIVKMPRKFARSVARAGRAIAANRAPPPDLKTLATAVVASVGSSVASGLIVNQRIVKPETAALLMAGVGGAGAYFTGGNLRVACTGIAAAGAGQYAIVKLGRAALRGKPEKSTTPQPPPPPVAPAPVPQSAPALPPGPKPRSADDGGAVFDLFRDAGAELELIDRDDLRHRYRDADPYDADEHAYRDADANDGDEYAYRDADRPIEIDLDDVA